MSVDEEPFEVHGRVPGQLDSREGAEAVLGVENKVFQTVKVEWALRGGGGCGLVVYVCGRAGPCACV